MKLTASIITLAVLSLSLTGCIKPGAHSVLVDSLNNAGQNLSNDHAATELDLTTPWGTERYRRVNPTTNQDVIISPDGTMTIKSH